MKTLVAALVLGLLLTGCAQTQQGGSTQSPQSQSNEKRATDFKSGTY